MPLPTGTWAANFAGTPQQLVVESVNTAGQVIGGIGADSANILFPFYGFWDEDGQELTMFIALPLAGNTLIATSAATAYLFTDPVNLTGVNGAVIFTLTGQIEYYGTSLFGVAPTARRSAFGWYAQIAID